MPSLRRKTSILLKLHYFNGQEVNRMPFFSDSSRINRSHCSQAHIFSKKGLFSQINCLSCHFISIFHQNPLLSSRYLVKKTQILSQPHYILDPKGQSDALLYRFFDGKITVLIPIFYQKSPFSKNTIFSCPYFVKKRPFSRKHRALI